MGKLGDADQGVCVDCLGPVSPLGHGHDAAYGCKFDEYQCSFWVQ